MEDFSNNNFEQFLRSSTDDFLMVPSRKVWYSIYNDMHPDRKWPSLAVCLLILCAVLYIGISNNNHIGNAARKASEENLRTIAVNYVKTQGTNYLDPLTVFGTTGPANIPQKISPPVVDKPTGHTLNENNLLTSVDEAIVYTEKIPDNTTKIAAAAALKTAVQNILQKTTGATSENIEQKIFTAGIGLPATKELRHRNTFAKSNTAINISSAAPDAETESVSLQADSSKIAAPADPAKNSIAQKMRTAQELLNKEMALQQENRELRKAAARTKFKANAGLSYYFTPSLGYRLLTRRDGFTPSAYYTQISGAAVQTAALLRDAPSLSLEAGAVLNYSVAKRIRLKAGVQFNYNNFTTIGTKLPHPTQSAIAVLNNSPVLLRGSEFSTDGNQTKFNHTSLQVSLPLGVDVALLNGSRVKWFVGTALQPTYNFGGNALVMSADKRNFIKETSLRRDFNLNIAAETFVSIRLKGGINFNAGPQFRYQVLSTYKKPYGYKENLISTGLKIGFTKGL